MAVRQAWSEHRRGTCHDTRIAWHKLQTHDCLCENGRCHDSRLDQTTCCTADERSAACNDKTTRAVRPPSIDLFALVMMADANALRCGSLLLRQRRHCTRVRRVVRLVRNARRVGKSALSFPHTNGLVRGLTQRLQRLRLRLWHTTLAGTWLGRGPPPSPAKQEPGSSSSRHGARVLGAGSPEPCAGGGQSYRELATTVLGPGVCRGEL